MTQAWDDFVAALRGKTQLCEEHQRRYSSREGLLKHLKHVHGLPRQVHRNARRVKLQRASPERRLLWAIFGEPAP